MNTLLFNSHMHLFSEDKKFRYCSSSFEVPRKKHQSKTNKLISFLKAEVQSLKKSHQSLSKNIREITKFFRSEMGKVISVFGNLPFSKQMKTSRRNDFCDYIFEQQRREVQKPLENIDIFWYSSGLKQKIMEQFKQLKDLEDRSNCLRKTNERLRSLRKSLSKESLQCKTQNARLPPKIFSKKHILPSSNTKQTHLKDISSTKESQLFMYSQIKQQRGLPQPNKHLSRLPYFDKIELKQNNQHSSNQKVAKRSLICSNGHLYYEGQTKNAVPHGLGTLINCCSEIPIKITSKFFSYQGGFGEGLFQGRGTMILKGNVRFEGCFRKGKRHGQGTIFLREVGQTGYWEYDKLQF